MNANNIDSIESTIIESVESIVVVEINSQTDEMVEIEMAGESDEVRRETKALIAALKRRAQSEANSAGTLTREAYLNVVRQAREAIEGRKVIERNHSLETSWLVIQDEAERNWYLLMKDMASFSVRVQKAAHAAWETFNDPRNQN